MKTADLRKFAVLKTLIKEALLIAKPFKLIL